MKMGNDWRCSLTANVANIYGYFGKCHIMRLRDELETSIFKTEKSL